jgi:hypothetical protein
LPELDVIDRTGLGGACDKTCHGRLPAGGPFELGKSIFRVEPI